MINKLIKILKLQYFYKLIIYFFIILFVTFVESIGLISLSSIIPVMNNTESVFPLLKDSKFYNQLNINDLIIIIVFIFAFKFCSLIYSSYYSHNLIQKLQNFYSYKLFSNYSNLKYEDYFKLRPSTLVRKIQSDVSSLLVLINSFLSIIKEGLILLVVVAILLSSNIGFLVLMLLFFASVLFIFYNFIKKRIYQLSLNFLNSKSKIIQIVNQSFGSIKENIIYKINNKLIDYFKFHQERVLYFEFYKNFVNSLPRFFFEIVAIIFLLLSLYYLRLQSLNNDLVLDKLALIAICAIRLLPSFNSITNSLTNIKSYKKILNNMYVDLIEKKQTNFKNNLNLIDKKNNLKFFSYSLKNVSYKYPNTGKYIIKNLNFNIKKNSFVGIYGETGAGKSTFVDLLLDIIKPDKGNRYLNNKNINFQSNLYDMLSVSYVPQKPFFLDDTIENNIIFNRFKNKNTKKNINWALKISQLDTFIKGLPKKTKTNLGNDAIKISGGQKQRIVLARALLLRPEIIILDEATNALDEDTEKALLIDLKKMKKYSSIIFISHNKEILNYCDEVYKLTNGKLSKR